MEDLLKQVADDGHRRCALVGSQDRKPPQRGKPGAAARGAAARALGLIQAEVAMGIPVSINGKSIYFDRQAPAKH